MIIVMCENTKINYKNIHKICGVDLGNKGGICFIEIPSMSMLLYDIPIITIKKGKVEKKTIDFPALFRIIDNENPDVVCFEDINSIFGVHKHTSFLMGYQKGCIETYCIIRNKIYKKIIPRIWQRFIFADNNTDIELKDVMEYGKTKTKTKKHSIDCANRYISLFNTTYYRFSKNKYTQTQINNINKSKDGIADAINIAMFYYKTNII